MSSLNLTNTCVKEPLIPPIHFASTLKHWEERLRSRENMLFLVISTPHPSRPEDVKDARAKFRTWIDTLKSKKKVVCFYPRVGRGSVVIFDVASNDELHELMTQWLNIVPVSFEIYPLATT